jgi:hypothetical protein
MIQKLPAPKLLSLTQMATRLQVTAKWLRDEAEAKRIPHLKADSRLLFNPEAVEAVLARRAGLTERPNA